jgi:hypothetical protein
LSGSPRVRKNSNRFVARPHLPFVGQILRASARILRFDLLEVLRHERTLTTKS